MIRNALLCFITVISGMCFGQLPSGSQLLDNSIKYHDPSSNWNGFNTSLKIEQLDAEKEFLGSRDVHIDIPGEYFYMKQIRGGNVITRKLQKGKCVHTYNDISILVDSIAQKHRLDCKTTKMYRDYFTYLYGLPMKLKDNGTIIDPKVFESELDGIKYLTLKVTYDRAIGGDIWYFYFDKNSYALKGYRFYHDEDEGDGEYIILNQEAIINGIKMPRDRYWYTNKEKKFLGADLLKN